MAGTSSSVTQSSLEPVLLVQHAGAQRAVIIDRSPFTIGRRTGNDLMIPDPHVSRDQAIIVTDNGQYVLEDRSSSFGTFVNGERVARRQLVPDDRITFGGTAVVTLTFSPRARHSAEHLDLLNSISNIPTHSGEAAELERLTIFLETARKLNSSSVLDEVLVTLVQATLRLTGAERGFVFLRDKVGTLRMAVGRDKNGVELRDESTISHSILNRAVNSGKEFVIGDTSDDAEFSLQQSIVAHDLRSVLCIPLVQQLGSQRAIRGALYLDSHFARHGLTAVSHELLHAIAAQAAALVENAQLAAAEQAARLYEQELSISAAIQQALMNVAIPQVPFASVRGRSLACKAVGGDFFDVVYDGKSLALVIADVSGKAVSAALLASIMQGLVYAELMSNIDLAEIAAVTNRYLCAKQLQGKYATIIVARLWPDGTLDYINCGHVPPCLSHAGKHRRLEDTNFPVGLLPDATYSAQKLKLEPGDRLVLVTDGVTEAQNAAEDFFGDDRFEQAVNCEASLDKLFAEIDAFRGEHPLDDDCTALELVFRDEQPA